MTIIPDLIPLAVPVADLDLLPGNPRRGDVDAVARSLDRFGQRKPVVARRSDHVVIAGNHTLQAARKLGWQQIAVVWVDDDDVTSKAFALADNRTGDLGGYDDVDLAALLSEVRDLDPDLLADTSWTEDDLTALLESNAASGTDSGAGDGSDANDKVPDTAPALTRAGDLWLLGPHRLLCGDCRNADDVARLLAGATINLAFSSPPYADRRKYDETTAFRPIPPDEYVEWFEPVAANVAAFLAADGSWFINIKPGADGLDTDLYVLDLVLAHAREWGWHFATEFCWERNGVPKTVTQRFKNQFEPIYQFARGRWKMRPDAVMHKSAAAITPGSTSGSLDQWQGREDYDPFDGLRGEGLAYPGNRLPTFAGTHEATGHAAAFPVGLPQWFIKAYTDEGDTVYDPFMGSGSTLLAANAEKRVGFGSEISPGYCDIICRRFQKLTGIKPVLEATGEAYDFDVD